MSTPIRTIGNITLPELDEGTPVAITPGVRLSGSYRRPSYDTSVDVESVLVLAVFKADYGRTMLLCAPDHHDVSDAALKRYCLQGFQADPETFRVVEGEVPDEWTTDDLFLVNGSERWGRLARFTQDNALELARLIEEARDVVPFSDVSLDAAIKVVYGEQAES